MDNISRQEEQLALPSAESHQELKDHLATHAARLITVLRDLHPGDTNSLPIEPSVAHNLHIAARFLCEASELVPQTTEADVEPEVAASPKEDVAPSIDTPAARAIAETPLPMPSISRQEVAVAPRTPPLARLPRTQPPPKPVTQNKNDVPQQPLKQPSSAQPPEQGTKEWLIARNVAWLKQDFDVIGRRLNLATSAHRNNPIMNINPEDRMVMSQVWSLLGATSRRAHIMATYYCKSPYEIASLLKENPVFITQALQVARQALEDGRLRLEDEALQQSLAGQEKSQNSFEIIPDGARLETLSKQPKIAVVLENSKITGDGPITLPDNRIRITRILFDTAIIEVREKRFGGTQSTKCAILASLGFSNKQIASQLYLSEDTIKTHVRRFMSNSGMTKRARSAIAPFMIDSGYYTVEKAGSRPCYSTRQRQIADLLISEPDNAAIGKKLNLSEDTVKTHLSRMFALTGTTSRAQIILIDLLSKKETSKP